MNKKYWKSKEWLDLIKKIENNDKGRINKTVHK